MRARIKAQPEQRDLFKRRGGVRTRAGRKPKAARPGMPHTARPELKARHPVHVVLRGVRAVGSLRRRDMYHAIRRATLCAAKRRDFRVVQISIQRTHVHLLVEANDRQALARGMQGLQISAAKHINAKLDVSTGRHRRGRVFSDRYHATIITSPRQARHALLYVLANWRKHGEDQAAFAAWKIDWYSSAFSFADWAENEPWLERVPASYLPLKVSPPETWLLIQGWKLHGKTLSCWAVPSASA